MNKSRPLRSIVAGLSLPALTAALSAALSLGCGDASIDTGSRGRARSFLYVGNEGGITWLDADRNDGSLRMKGNLQMGLTAAFMVGSSDGKFLYSTLRTVNEMQRVAEMQPLESHVGSFAIDPVSGGLREIGRVPSGGDRPTYITVDKNNRYVMVANALGHMVGNSVTVLPVRPDGSLAPAQQAITTGMGAHQIRVHPSNKFVYVPNYWSDYISQLIFDESTGTLTPNEPPTVAVEKGAQPRHLDFHPNGRWVYLSLEFTAQVKAYNVNENGTLTEFQTISALLPTYMGRKWQSEIRVAPSGRYVYVGERVDESLAIFEVDQNSGKLTLKGHQATYGKTPRNFVLDPTGDWLVVGNQESNSLVSFQVDPDTGSLKKRFGPMDLPTPYVHVFMTIP